MATYEVRTSGVDSGSVGPFRTINYAINTVGFAGNTILVRGGVYNHSCLSWQNTIRSGTSWSNAITVKAYPGETVVLRPASGLAAFWFKAGPSNATIQYWIIQDFIIDCQVFGALHGVKLQLARFGETYGGPNFVRLSNFEIKWATASGLLIDGNGHEFLNQNVHHCGGTDYHNHGIYLEGSDCLIDGGEWSYNAGWGIHHYNSYAGERADDNIVRNAYCHHNGTTGTGMGIIMSSGSNGQCYNCIAAFNPSGGIGVQYNNPSGMKILHATTYRNGGPGIVVNAEAANTQVKNCITRLDTSPGIRNLSSSTTLANNLPPSVDPMFVNA